MKRIAFLVSLLFALPTEADAQVVIVARPLVVVPRPVIAPVVQAPPGSVVIYRPFLFPLLRPPIVVQVPPTK